MSSFDNKSGSVRRGFSGFVPRFLAFCLVIFPFLTSCGGAEADLRKLAPKDAIVYLETNDLGAVLDVVTESPAFTGNTSVRPDLSDFGGMRAAVVVTGFETSEKRVTEDRAVLRYRPRFAFIAETGLWSWQIPSLVEERLGGYVRRTYGGDVRLERRTLGDTERYVWTSGDGRRAYAVTEGGRVFFGNDEETVNKCLLAGRGEAESLLADERLSLAHENAAGALAFGYVSGEGVARIADLAGITVALGQTDDENARGFISGVVPQLLKKGVREIVWTARRSGPAVEDEILIRTDPEAAAVLGETIVPSRTRADEIYAFLPPETVSATRYDLKEPRIAYRSLLLTAAGRTDGVNGRIIAAFSNSLLGSYGVADAEKFLGAVDSHILTARLDETGERKLSVVRIGDPEALKSAVVEGIDLGSEPTAVGRQGKLWVAAEEDLAVSVWKDFLLIGDPASVRRGIDAREGQAGKGFAAQTLFGRFRESREVAVTLSTDAETAAGVVGALGRPVPGRRIPPGSVLTRTGFTNRGIERRYISDFGFFGTMVTLVTGDK